MIRYLVDNGVWQRLPRRAEVREAVEELLDNNDELCCCALSLDEFGFSARSLDDYRRSADRLRSSFLFLPSSDQADSVAASIRAALWTAGKGRVAGVVDVAIAAIAVTSASTVLHYDSDFDHLAEVFPALHTRWVVPRGSIP